MKKAYSIQYLTILVLFSLMSIISAQGSSTPGYTKVYSDSWGEAGFSLERQAPTGVEINHSIKEFSLQDIEIAGEPMQVLHLPGNFLPGEEGAPDLPGSGRYIALPQGATASLRIMDSRTETFHDIDIAPAFRIPLETEVGPLEYRKNMDIYSTDAYYPSSPVILSEPTQIRGVDVVIVGIKPFQYNPVTRELIVYRDLRVEVNFDGGNGHFGEDRLRSRWWDPVLRDVLINYASLPEIEHRYKSSHTDVVEDVEYLIIVPDDPDFIAWADSIKVFRTLQGIRTGVVTTTELGGNTTTAIETYIDNAYASWDPAPVAVLLLADYGTSGSTIISPVWDNYCISDNIYADYNNNQLPDMSFARITAQDASDLSTMIGKFLDYERQPPTNPNYYQHPVAAGGWQSDRWFILCSDIIWGFWNNELNKQPVREYSGYSGAPPYWSTNSNTSLIVNYFGPNGLGYIPATPSHLTDWGANATRINADINSGAFMMQHRDHGSETGWGDPSYHISDLSGLDNDDLVFVFSVNCLTGKFNWYSECFAEAFHRHDKGALGIVAASEISYSFVNDTYVWGMYDNMWPDFDPGYGGNIFDTNYILPSFASASGKYYLQVSSWPSNPYSKNTVYYLFHHHGDAFTTVYTEFPQNLTVTHDPVLVSGVSSFTVTADIGSFISLTVDGEIIGVGDGYSVYPTVIPISPQLPGNTMEITVTKQNYYRYSLSVPIINPDEDVSIMMTPLNSPANPSTVIPAGGGSFNFDVSMVNNCDIDLSFNAAIMVELPNGDPYGPVLGPITVNMVAYSTIDMTLSQSVPGSAPSGDYTYTGYLFYAPTDIIDSDGFGFTKLGTIQGAGTGEEWRGYYADTGVEVGEKDLWTVDGIYREDGTSIYGSLSVDENLIPDKFALYHNYPNPFNPVTTIRYDLPEQSYVTIVIYDLMGREVKRLVRPRRAYSEPGRVVSGYHKAVWDGTDSFGKPVSAGIYLYQIRATDPSTFRQAQDSAGSGHSFIQTRKMVLIK